MSVWSGSADLGLGLDAAGLRVLLGGPSGKHSRGCVGGCSLPGTLAPSWFPLCIVGAGGDASVLATLFRR